MSPRKNLTSKCPIGTGSANPVESDLGCTARVYFDTVRPTSCKCNNKFDCRETNGYNIPQYTIITNFIYSVGRIMDLNRADPNATKLKKKKKKKKKKISIFYVFHIDFRR